MSVAAEEEAAAEARLEERLGYVFVDRDLLRTALTHRSHTAGPGAQNETLEFLGDAVLGLVVTDLLVRTWPRVGEGRLTRRKASLVSAISLAQKAAGIGLGDFLLLGRGEEKTRGREKPSILAGALEAILGAIFLEGGFEAARAVIELLFRGDVVGEEPAAYGGGEFKTQLQETLQRDLHASPEYALSRTTGPDHAREFHVEVSVEGRILGHGSGSSKKIAESAAAREALETLQRDASGQGAGEVRDAGAGAGGGRFEATPDAVATRDRS